MEAFNFNDYGILRLPPGFRFHPTDEELVVHYLNRKVQSIPLPFPIPEADVCRSDPWSLPGDMQKERYFFCRVETKYPNGIRTNRTAPSGYWRPTGFDKRVVDGRNRHIGTKKTLVFYRSRAPNGLRTNWIMHEYKIANSSAHGVGNWVICRVFMKKRAREDVVNNDAEMVQVGNRGHLSREFFGGLRDFDLNLDGGGSSSSCSSGVTVAGEGEENSK